VERRWASAPGKARAAPAGAASLPRPSAFRLPLLLSFLSVLKALIVTAPAPTAGVI
jgi:hypothetical protein